MTPDEKKAKQEAHSARLAAKAEENKSKITKEIDSKIEPTNNVELTLKNENSCKSSSNAQKIFDRKSNILNGVGKLNIGYKYSNESIKPSETESRTNDDKSVQPERERNSSQFKPTSNIKTKKGNSVFDGG